MSNTVSYIIVMYIATHNEMSKKKMAWRDWNALTQLFKLSVQHYTA